MSYQKLKQELLIAKLVYKEMKSYRRTHYFNTKESLEKHAREEIKYKLKIKKLKQDLK